MGGSVNKHHQTATITNSVSRRISTDPRSSRLYRADQAIQLVRGLIIVILNLVFFVVLTLIGVVGDSLPTCPARVRHAFYS